MADHSGFCFLVLVRKNPEGHTPKGRTVTRGCRSFPGRGAADSPTFVDSKLEEFVLGLMVVGGTQLLAHFVHVPAGPVLHHKVAKVARQPLHTKLQRPQAARLGPAG